jgi:hypothetical protein
MGENNDDAKIGRATDAIFVVPRWGTRDHLPHKVPRAAPWAVLSHSFGVRFSNPPFWAGRTTRVSRREIRATTGLLIQHAALIAVADFRLRSIGRNDRDEKPAAGAL